jgi:HEAT repeat protein
MRVSRCGQLLVAGWYLSGSVPVAAEAAKQPTAAAAVPAKPAAQSAELLRAARTKLEAADPASVEQALGQLAELGGEQAAQAVVARLRRGLPPQLTGSAIDALVRIKSPSAASVLLELTLHRRAPIRVKAVAALGTLKVRSAQSALLYALDDPSPEVRGSAVQALASVGNARALPALLTAADRGVAGAWQAVGSLATAADFKRLLSQQAGGDVTLLRPALDVMIARSDLPLDAKLRTVQELEKLGSPSARACLASWLTVAKNTGPARVRQGLLDAIKRMDGGGDPAAVHLTLAAPGGAKAAQPGVLAAAPAADREAAK